MTARAGITGDIGKLADMCKCDIKLQCLLRLHERPNAW